MACQRRQKNSGLMVSPMDCHGTPPRPRHRRSRTPKSSPEPQHPYPPADLTWWSPPALRELRRWVRWAGGAGRREGQHRLHTFEELTRTPRDPHDYAPEAAMPQTQWETLLRDVVQGLHPPLHPRDPPLVAPDHPPRGMGHQRPPAPDASPPPRRRKGGRKMD